MGKDNLYEILGVDSTAAIGEIKDRYRFLCHTYHPDKYATENHRKMAAEQFVKIQNAYLILSDQNLRSSYDESRKPPRQDSSKKPPVQATKPPPKRPRTFRIIKRVVGIGLGVFGILVLVILVAYVEHLNYEKRSLTLIKESGLILTDFKFQPSIGDSYASGKVTGDIRNKSSYTLKNITLKVILMDHREKRRGGILISDEVLVFGEDSVTCYLSIPPNQIRKFVSDASFGRNTPKPLGRVTWNYEIVRIQAQE